MSHFKNNTVVYVKRSENKIVRFARGEAPINIVSGKQEKPPVSLKGLNLPVADLEDYFYKLAIKKGYGRSAIIEKESGDKVTIHSTSVCRHFWYWSGGDKAGFWMHTIYKEGKWVKLIRRRQWKIKIIQ